MNRLDNEQIVNTNEFISIANVKLKDFFELKWFSEINRENAVRGNGRNKLRTYKQFKKDFMTEEYVKRVMPRSHRSALAKFRCGTAPIRIETGRYERNRPSAENRTCYICNDGIEDEKHVLLKCSLYEDLRNELVMNVMENNTNYNLLSEDEKSNNCISCGQNPTSYFDKKATFHDLSVIYKHHLIGYFGACVFLFYFVIL